MYNAPAVGGTAQHNSALRRSMIQLSADPGLLVGVR